MEGRRMVLTLGPRVGVVRPNPPPTGTAGPGAPPPAAPPAPSAPISRPAPAAPVAQKPKA